MNNSNSIKVIIVEDDLDAQAFLVQILSDNFSTLKLEGIAPSIKTAIQLIQNVQPELVFMDIDLTDGFSFEIFESIKNPQFEVIFITALDHFMQKALDHFALSYILKPIDPSKLIASINHYVQLKQRLFNVEKFDLLKKLTYTNEGQIMIQTSNEHILIKIKSIVKCEAEGNYSTIYVNDGEKLLASKSLKYYETLLKRSSFFRVNRTIMINVNFIQSIYKKETIILKNGEKLHVSVRNRSKLIDLIQSLA